MLLGFLLPFWVRREGAVFPSLFGGVVFLPLLWVVAVFHLSSVGWCCLVFSFLLGGVAVFPSPSGGVVFFLLVWVELRSPLFEHAHV